MAQDVPESQPQFLLPRVEEEVLESFEQHLPNFEVLYRQLQLENPALAVYILRRAEQLAPRDINAKNKYARVALELAGILSAQQAIIGIRESMDLSSLVESPSADEYGDGEVQPPAV
jgi:hypothetical protein